jgi:hypothetical protein
MQHFVDQAWQRVLGEPRADGGPAREPEREAWLWRFRRASGAAVERPRPPSRRMARAHMPRRAFMVLALGWIVGVATLFGIVLALRWIG